MSDQFDSLTHLSLLIRLGDADRRQEAWSEFLNVYIEMILNWCRFWGVQEADAEEVLQETILSVYRGFHSFERLGPGSFRGWLKTVARHNWTRVAECRRRSLGMIHPTDTDIDFDRLASTREARDHLYQLFDEWATRELLDLAMARVQARVQPSSWRVFELLTFEHMSAEDAAVEMKMTPQNIYLIIFRVRKLITAEMATLDPENKATAKGAK